MKYLPLLILICLATACSDDSSNCPPISVNEQNGFNLKFCLDPDVMDCFKEEDLDIVTLQTKNQNDSILFIDTFPNFFQEGVDFVEFKIGQGTGIDLILDNELTTETIPFQYVVWINGGDFQLRLHKIVVEEILFGSDCPEAWVREYFINNDSFANDFLKVVNLDIQK